MIALLLAALVGQSLPEDGFRQAAIQDVFRKVSPAIVLIRYSTEILNPGSGETTRRAGEALGLLVNAQGLVMTHGHILLENRTVLNVEVSVGEGESLRRFDATLLPKPEDVNVVFLQISNAGERTFPYVTFEAGERLELGEPILTIGILSESFDHARAVQTRRVGAVLTEPRLTYALDQPVSLGYVGAPVVDTNKRLIGVLGFDLAPSEGGEIYTRSGHPLVFQADLFTKYIAQPPTEDGGGAADDAWLGVFTQPLTDDLATYWNLPKNGGIVVSTIIPGSPAEQMGLIPGDVVVGFNGTPITAKQDSDVTRFTQVVRDSPVGESIPVQLYRNGQPTELALTLTTRPKTSRDAAEFEDELLGLTVREVTTDVRIALNLPSGVNGVLVRRVRSGSPANQAGLRPGILVLSIGGAPVTSIDEYQAAINALSESKPSEVLVFARVGATTAFFRLEPRWPASE